MSKLDVVLEVVLLLQGTPLGEFARDNFSTDGGKAIVKCATQSSVASDEGLYCKRAVATAFKRYSYRFNTAQTAVLAELYVHALNALEPDALPRVRDRMCDPTSEEVQRDEAAAAAVCERISLDY